MLLQSAICITTYDSLITVLLQSATGITKCDDYYKVRQNHPVNFKLFFSAYRNSLARQEHGKMNRPHLVLVLPLSVSGETSQNWIVSRRNISARIRSLLQKTQLQHHKQVFRLPWFLPRWSKLHGLEFLAGLESVWFELSLERNLSGLLHGSACSLHWNGQISR